MLALLLALAVQTPLLPVARGQTRSGVAVVVVAAEQSPWAVVQLHVRLEGSELPPRVRAATTAWSALLADAGRRALGPTGTTETRLTPDSLVISFGVEAARFDDALRALDSVLRGRAPKLPTTQPLVPGSLQVTDDVVDAAGARALFPGQPLALSLEGAPLDAAALQLLAGAMTPDRLALVVAGPDSTDALLARVNRTITAPLPKAQNRPAPSSSSTPSKTITEKPGPSSSSSVAVLIPARQDAAGLLVLASLLGGRLVRSSAAVGVVVDVTAADRVALVAAEDDVLEQIRRVAAAPPPPEVTEAARDKVLRGRLSTLNDPARVAHALGQAVLDGRPTRVEDEVASLQSLTPSQVSLAAAALAAAVVVVTRTPGPDPIPPTTPAKP